MLLVLSLAVAASFLKCKNKVPVPPLFSNSFPVMVKPSFDNTTIIGKLLVRVVENKGVSPNCSTSWLHNRLASLKPWYLGLVQLTKVLGIKTFQSLEDIEYDLLEDQMPSAES